MKKLLVGLGNPESVYQKTRHNVGQMFVDWLADKWELNWEKRKDLQSLVCQKDEIVLAKPLVFMNESGKAVRKLKDKLKVKDENIYIVHDELDLPLGKYLVSFARSSPLHKGILSIEQQLKANQFWRIRIGVDNRDKENRIAGEKYVLQKFKNDEIECVFRIYSELLNDLSIDE